MIRISRIPEQVLINEVLERVKKYDANEHRFEQVWELTRIFNQHNVTLEKICGLCNEQFNQVLNLIKQELKKRGIYEG